MDINIADANRHKGGWMLQLIIFLLLSISTALSYGATNSSGPQIQLDEDYQKVTTRAYHELCNASAYLLPQADLNTLINAAVSADDAHKPEGVICVATANMAVVQKNVNAKELPSLTALVLKHHALGIAKEIADLVSNQGDVYAQAKQNFQIAKYEADQHHWDKAIDWLKKIDITNELPKENGDEANIIYGAALQYKKKHREALSYYARVKADSRFYPIAQLNSALGYIRQDWWTDAQIAIEKALGSAGKNDIEIVNRLYTILGFSQLQQGFYRNARESFRNVKIKSAYANRALLGVGMAALNQEDFVGALNAFNQLKTHPENDMSVAQSYLLAAFTLAKIKQSSTASTSYTEAINYYEQKNNFYENMLNEIKGNSASNPSLLVNKISADFEKEDPELNLIIEQLKTLGFLSGQSLSSNNLLQINKLNSGLYAVFLAKAEDVVAKKQTAFNSYLNQSRFGFTKLYDTPN